MRFYALRLHEVGHDQVEPERDPRRGHRLALPERAQARAEGVSHAGGVRAGPDASRGASYADHPDRRDFLAAVSAAGAPGVLGARGSLADEGPPETTTLRLRASTRAICLAPGYIAEDLLRAEGFTDIRYVDRAADPPTVARGEIDFDFQTRGMGRLPAGCRRAGHGVGGCAFRLLRAVRARADPQHQRSQGQEGRHPGPRLERAPAISRSSRPTSGSTPQQDIDWVSEPDRQPHGAVRRRQGRRFPRLPARAAGAARAQARPHDPQHDHGQAMVAVFLLHGLRQPRLRPRSSGRHQALSARHPQGRRHVCHRAGDGPRNGWSMRGFTRALRLRAPDAERASLRPLARVRPGGRDALLRAAAARGGHDQVAARTRSSPRAPTGAS